MKISTENAEASLARVFTTKGLLALLRDIRGDEALRAAGYRPARARNGEEYWRQGRSEPISRKLALEAIGYRHV
jgi:hypothetical protein